MVQIILSPIELLNKDITPNLKGKPGCYSFGFTIQVVVQVIQIRKMGSLFCSTRKDFKLHTNIYSR